MSVYFTFRENVLSESQKNEERQDFLQANSGEEESLNCVMRQYTILYNGHDTGNSNRKIYQFFSPELYCVCGFGQETYL